MEAEKQQSKSEPSATTFQQQAVPRLVQIDAQLASFAEEEANRLGMSLDQFVRVATRMLWRKNARRRRAAEKIVSRQSDGGPLSEEEIQQFCDAVGASRESFDLDECPPEASEGCACSTCRGELATS